MPKSRTVLSGVVLLALLAGCGDARAEDDAKPAAAQKEARFGTEIHLPASLTSIPTGRKDPLGRELRAPCVTCHGQREGAALPEEGNVKSPHAGLTLAHGDLTCGSCHDEKVTHEFSLADGRRVGGREVMRLCAQCHGLQYRSYRNGTHGGMSGHWDLSRGPRSRNHCVDCHDSHAPAFGMLNPAPGPRDRFVGGGKHE